MNINNKKDEEKMYNCGYCRNSFKKIPKVFGSHEKGNTNNCVSNQIKCNNCGNFLPTWEKNKVKRRVKIRGF